MCRREDIEMSDHSKCKDMENILANKGVNIKNNIVYNTVAHKTISLYVLRAVIHFQ